jgi:hypothetical protein
MTLIENYNKALQDIYDHVGFEEDYVIYPIDDSTENFWTVDDDSVKYGPSIDVLESNGDFYQDDIYKQRFYDKWVYRGDDITMIFCDPGVDGMKYFRIFDNLKEIK